MVLAVDEKSQMQALDRTAPVLPMMPAVPGRTTHDYIRHGTTSLFAALDITTGTVIGQHQRRHRHQEFLRFLKTIDAQTPPELDLHLICDNYATHKTPAIKTWLAAHPRFHLHFTPTYSSWLTIVERWFAELTNRKLRRCTHHSVKALEADVTAWIQAWNDDPKPFVWTKTADEILANLAHYLTRINQLTNARSGTKSSEHGDIADVLVPPGPTVAQRRELFLHRQHPGDTHRRNRDSVEQPGVLTKRVGGKHPVRPSSLQLSERPVRSTVEVGRTEADVIPDELARLFRRLRSQHRRASIHQSDL